MKAPLRACQLLDRMIASLNQLGLVNTLRIFSYLLPGKDIVRVIRKTGREFHFYPAADKGVVSHFYKPGYRIHGDPRLIVDVGANIGDEVFRFRSFHPTAKIIAIEPAMRNYAMLRQNFESDHDTILIHGALWWEACELRLSSPSTSSHEGYFISAPNASASNNGHSEAVRAYTMQEILAQHGLSNSEIDIFKIDVEGAERFIFCRGDRDWLLRVNVIIMEMPDNDAPGSFQDIIDTLSSLGIRGNSYICGENFVFCKQGSGFGLDHVVGLGQT